MSYGKRFLIFWFILFYGKLNAQVKDVHYYNRYSKKMETEKIMGKGLIKILSNNRIGNKIVVNTGERISRLMGKWNDLPASAGKVGQFVQDYSISMKEFVIPNINNRKTLGYKSFNHFFTRCRSPTPPVSSVVVVVVAVAVAVVVGVGTVP